MTEDRESSPEPCPECGGASMRYCRTCQQPQDTCNHSGNYERRALPSIAPSVYESAVKGRQDFRRATVIARSERAALAALLEEAIAIHDGARSQAEADVWARTVGDVLTSQSGAALEADALECVLRAAVRGVVPAPPPEGPSLATLVIEALRDYDISESLIPRGEWVAERLAARGVRL